MIQSKLYSNIQKILAYSKSFLTVLGLILKCILYPGAHLFVTSGGKQQSAEILSQKVQELCRLIPPLEREINWSRGKTQEGKDYVKYIFKNGSVLDNLAAKESSRGQRRHGRIKIYDAILVDFQRNVFAKFYIYQNKLDKDVNICEVIYIR